MFSARQVEKLRLHIQGPVAAEGGTRVGTLAVHPWGPGVRPPPGHWALGAGTTLSDRSVRGLQEGHGRPPRTVWG